MEGECYLFDCGTPEDFTCVFDHHARFMSGALEVNRHQFDKISRGHQGRNEKRFCLVPISAERCLMVYRALTSGTESLSNQ